MRFETVRLQTADPSALSDFYRRVLGLPAAGPGAVRTGATELVFDRGAPARYHFAFNIPENMVEPARQWLGERVAIVRHEGRDVVDFPAWNAHSLYFFDPAGNIVELIARHNLKNAAEGPFGPEHWLNVSEVGLAVPELGPAIDAIEAHTGEGLWSGNRQGFAAVGGEDGLFIVVPTGRVWFMTEDVTAETYPLGVAIAEGRPGHMVGVPEAYDIRTTPTASGA